MSFEQFNAANVGKMNVFEFSFSFRIAMYKYYGKPGREYLTNLSLVRNAMFDPSSLMQFFFLNRKCYTINNWQFCCTLYYFFMWLMKFVTWNLIVLNTFLSKVYLCWAYHDYSLMFLGIQFRTYDHAVIMSWY